MSTSQLEIIINDLKQTRSNLDFSSHHDFVENIYNINNNNDFV